MRKLTGEGLTLGTTGIRESSKLVQVEGVWGIFKKKNTK